MEMDRRGIVAISYYRLPLWLPFDSRFSGLGVVILFTTQGALDADTYIL